MTTPITIHIDGETVRTMTEWRQAAPYHNGTKTSPMHAARLYARKHGAAGIWRADDSFVLIYRDHDKLRQKTWRNATMCRTIQERAPK